VLKAYRARKLPIDNVVMDWRYWKDDQWGSHRFDETRFPDPQKMLDDIHGMNGHFMISIWPKFYPWTEHFKELDAKGFMYKRNIEQGAVDWVGPGYANSFYDPYAKEARDIYWRQVRDSLKRYGVDAGGWTATSRTCTPTSTLPSAPCAWGRRAGTGRGVLQLLSAGPHPRRVRGRARA